MEMIDCYTRHINNFVSGKLNIAKNRFTKPIEQGGLGLFDLGDFLDAQKLSWIKRASNLDDWWKISLYSKSFGNIFNIRKKNFQLECEPCQYSIVSSYEQFIKSYTSYGHNFTNSYLFENNALSLGIRDKRLVSRNLFTLPFFNVYGNKIANLSTRDILKDDGSYISRELFNTNMGIPFTVFDYQMLKGIVETAKVRFQHNVTTSGHIVDVQTFLCQARKGSKRFRKVLTIVANENIPHNIVKFSDNMDIVLGIEDSKKVNSFWNLNNFSNSTRTFLFKLYNNLLGYNTVVSHFIRNHSRNCTFCDIIGDQDITDETPLHLFAQCQVVDELVCNVFRWLTDDNAFVTSRKEQFALFDRADLNKEQNYVLTFVSKIVLKFIWDSKQRYCIPNLNHCKITIVNELESVSAISGKFKNIYNASGYRRLLA
jgi:hypothetical protein